MLEATGRDPADAVEEELRAYRRQLLLTLRAARDQLGRWPGGREWKQVRNFCSWETACREADRVGVEQP
jgi:hypothetical protein